MIEMNRRLESNEELDALVSLELVMELLPRVITNVHHWKWVILALYNSLQGFMVLALQGTNALNVLTEKSAQRWMEAYEQGKTYTGEPRLDLFPSLYEKIKSGSMLMYADSRQFVPTDAQEHNINKLKELRDNFTHFVPKRLSLDVSDWPNMVIDIIETIEFLAFQSGNVMWHEDALQEKTQALCLLVKQQASALKAHYGG